MCIMTQPERQYVRLLFLKLDQVWRRMTAAEQAAQKRDLAESILQHRRRMLLRSYSLAGTRGDADLLLWQVADDVEAFHGFQTELWSTRMGGYLSIAHSYLGVIRRSMYQFPEDPRTPRLLVGHQDAPYLFVYPFVKTRAWYALPLEQRQEMMEEHIRIGRKFQLRLNTFYSFGLDEQEFVVAFEGDDPSDFVSLVMELRETKASAYTLRDTPAFTCIQMSLWDVLDSLGGAAPATATTSATDQSGGWIAVARRDELVAGGSLRVYHGAFAVALFDVRGRVLAVSDRCTHGRASLSEGLVDPETCMLTCPWHGGTFDLETGAPGSVPARVAIKTWEVRVDDGWIHVR